MSAILSSALGICKTFTEAGAVRPTLSDCSCDIRSGELTLISGPAGSGKSTLASILGGLLPPSSGTVTLCGHVLSECDAFTVMALRRRHLGFIFQNSQLFPALTALDNVARVLVLNGSPRSAARQRAAFMLERVGLREQLDRRPAQLSSGQKQRVAIARALATEPALLIGDEVTEPLDAESAPAIVALLREHVTSRSAIVLLTRDPRLAPWAHRVLRMKDGTIRAVAGGAATHAPRLSGAWSLPLS